MTKEQLDEYIKILKPCPFCGKKATIEYNSGSYGYTPYGYTVKCPDMCAHFSHDGEKWEQGKGHYDISEKALNYLWSKWNNRKNESALLGQL